MYYSTVYHSKISDIHIVSDGDAIVEMIFSNQKSKFQDSVENNELDIFIKVKRYLDDYFRGNNPRVNFKIKPEGTEFRQKVWNILSEIPYGNIVTYGDIAREISPTMSAQAVGGAVGANPIVIIIPCHRVIGSDGSLTGYAAGLDIKKELLKIENSY